MLLATAALAGCSVSRGSNPSGDQSDQGPTSSRSEFAPNQDNPDPARKIEGVRVTEYEAGLHVEPTRRVAYDHSPPYGGPHDYVWANCDGTVYDVPVRSENMVHSLEHGAVWIAYDPDEVEGAALETLAERVEGVPYMMMSPYPGLETAISLQSWGHQLALTDVDDPRVDQFIAALRQNDYTSPEPGARCDSQDTGFDVTNPPPFEPGPPGPDAMPMDGG